MKQHSDEWKSLTAVIIRAAQARFMTAILSGHTSLCHTQVICNTAVGICIRQTQRDLLMEEILRSALSANQIKGLELLYNSILIASKWTDVDYKPQNFIFHFIAFKYWTRTNYACMKDTRKRRKERNRKHKYLKLQSEVLNQRRKVWNSYRDFFSPFWPWERYFSPNCSRGTVPAISAAVGQKKCLLNV